MIDLLLALIATVPGAAALAAGGVSLASFYYLPRLAPYALAAAVVFGALAYVTRIADELDETRRELAAKDKELAQSRAYVKRLTEVTDHLRDVTKQRTAKRTEQLRAIQRSPASDNGPLAPVLRRVLERAD